MRLLVVRALAADRVDELEVVLVAQALHLHRRLADGDGRAAEERDGLRDDLGRLVLEDVDELLVAVERDRALGAIVVLHQDRPLRPDDVAAGVRHLAAVGRRPLRHDLRRRLEPAVVPVEGNRGQRHAGTHLRLARLVDDLHLGGQRVGELVVGVRLDALRLGDAAELEPAEREVHRVARHVAERARAEVVEPAPGERVVDVLVELPRIVHVGVIRILVEERALRGRCEPGVPVQPVADLVALRMALHPVGDGLALRPHGAVRPHVDLLRVSEDAALQHLRAATHRGEGGPLVAHLHDHVVVLRRAVEVVELPEGAHERLLHVDVDALLHRADRHRGVDVVGRGDRHRVDAEHPGAVKELAVVGEERHAVHVEVDAVLRKPLLRLLAHRVVGVAERDHLDEARLQHRRPVAVALAHHADRGEPYLLPAARADASADGEGRSPRKTSDEAPS